MSSRAAQQSLKAELPPPSMKQLRACLHCKLIKTAEQFKEDGCPNCPSSQGIRDTTPTYTGTIAMMKPSESWVARWQRQESRMVGLYAMSVTGTLSTESESINEEQDEAALMEDEREEAEED